MAQREKSGKRKRRKTAPEPENTATPKATQPEAVEANGTAKPEAEVKQAVVVPVDEPINEKVEIIKLLDEGYSVKQIIDLEIGRASCRERG